MQIPRAAIQDKSALETNFGPLSPRRPHSIKRSILAFWVAARRPSSSRSICGCATSGKIAADETVAPVLDPGLGRTNKGYFWALARDDRPWGGTDPPAIAYSYAPGRGAVHALKLLDGYRGIVQCDGYADCKTTADKAPGRGDHACFLLGTSAPQVLGSVQHFSHIWVG